MIPIIIQSQTCIFSAVALFSSTYHRQQRTGHHNKVCCLGAKTDRNIEIMGRLYSAWLGLSWCQVLCGADGGQYKGGTCHLLPCIEIYLGDSDGITGDQRITETKCIKTEAQVRLSLISLFCLFWIKAWNIVDLLIYWSADICWTIDLQEKR